MQPGELVSKMAIKLSKKNIQNYNQKSIQVYLKGDRIKFKQVSIQIALMADAGRRLNGEIIFCNLKKVMDKIQKESNRVNVQKVAELGGEINILISKYYNQPSHIYSNRAIKLSNFFLKITMQTLFWVT